MVKSSVGHDVGRSVMIRSTTCIRLQMRHFYRMKLDAGHVTTVLCHASPACTSLRGRELSSWKSDNREALISLPCRCKNDGAR